MTLTSYIHTFLIKYFLQQKRSPYKQILGTTIFCSLSPTARVFNSQFIYPLSGMEPDGLAV